MAAATKYALCCKNCGFIEDKAWQPPTDTEHSKRTEQPLTPRSPAPMTCPKCGAGPWRVATQEQLDAHEEKRRRAARAAELVTREPDPDGLFKIPDAVRGSQEVKIALSNLLGPLEGKTLELAQEMVLRASRNGIAAEADVWIDLYDRAVDLAKKKAKESAKGSAAAAGTSK